MSSPVDTIKSRLSITDVVSSYLKLEKAGSNFKARCPFHNEKTPSFFVSPSRESFHCFGCGKGGDIFSFVEEIEGLDFMGALKILAERAGVPLEPMNWQERSEKEKLYAILEETTTFFIANLKSDPDVLKYLEERGLSAESIESWRLGYAKAEWRDLLSYLKGRGYAEADMEKAGLIIRAEPSSKNPAGGWYDRFRDRIMFPLFDQSGRVAGFSGRIFREQTGGSAPAAKYVNTPETPLYNKSRILYGYNRAKSAIREKSFCVLVEGQMDLILSHQAGMANTVAVSGTALTDYHLGLIKRLIDDLVMAFDGDPAGMAAARRAINLGLNLDLSIKAALLPPGADPADVVKKDPAAWRAAVTGATNIIDFCLDILAAQKLDSLQLNDKVKAEVLPYVARIGNAINQAYFVSKISSFLNTREEAVWEELKKARLRLVQETGTEPETVAAPSPRTRMEMLEERIFGVLFWLESQAEQAAKTAWLDLEQVLTAEVFKTKKEHYEVSKGRLILEAELANQGNDNLAAIVDELLTNLKEEILRRQLEEILIKIKAAERGGNIAQLEEYLKKCQTLSQAINNLKRQYAQSQAQKEGDQKSR